MRQFGNPEGLSPRPSSSGERRRLLMMAAGLVLVMAALGTSLLKAREYSSEEAAEIPAQDEPGMTEQVDVPRLDVARLETLVHERTGQDRVMLESDALDLMTDVTRRLTPRHFSALGARELDAEEVARIVADPAAYRGRAYSLRGTIETLRTRRRDPSLPEENIGRLLLEDGGIAYFVAARIPDLGGFVRFDGLFLKVYSDESRDEPGRWLDGPLFVGPEAVRAYRDLGTVTELDPALMAEVTDDRLVPAPTDITGLPFEPLWNLVAYARDLAPDAVDWESAPELDRAAMERLLDHPEEYRAQPFRIPISRLQGARVRAQGENPARVELMTDGWIGNTTWQNVVHFKTPHEYRNLELRDHVTGRGFFFKNFAYESAGKGLRIAPVFVMSSMTKIQARRDPIFAWLAAGVVVMTIVLGITLFVLVRRDRRRTSELQQKLLERKRARRRAAAADGESIGPVTS